MSRKRLSDRQKLKNIREKYQNAICKHCGDTHWYFCIIRDSSQNTTKGHKACLTCSAAYHQIYRDRSKLEMSKDADLTQQVQVDRAKRQRVICRKLTDGYLRSAINNNSGYQLPATMIPQELVDHYREQVQLIRKLKEMREYTKLYIQKLLNTQI